MLSAKKKTGMYVHCVLGIVIETKWKMRDESRGQDFFFIGGEDVAC